MMPPEPPPSPLRLEIDAGRLAANWQALDKLSGSAAAGAAVKADAYGVGVDRVVPVLRDAGCRDFFVAHWQEVAPVLKHVPADAIAVLHGPLNPQDAAYAQACGVKPVINSVEQARLWNAAGGGPCHLMVDTGINRLGIALSDAGDPAIAALDIDVLASHLASAEEDSPLNGAQQQRWLEARRAVRHKRSSLANSAGITLGSAYHGELTRPGLALYGGIPCPALEGVIGQVVTPQAMVMQVRTINAGDSVGYNATFVAHRPMRTGVISLGYADGFLRCWSGKGTLQAKGVSIPVLGRVSMDMTVVDLSAAPDVGAGDWLSVDYHLPSAASASGLSQYELLTLLGKRFSR